MIDQTAFFSLSYGLYIVGATDGERRAACVANTFQQVTSSPLQVSVALNKENATTDVILDSGRFTVSCLAQDATMELIGTFGFRCSTDLDKFASCETGVDAAGVPFVAEQCVARFSVRVVQAVNLGTHILYIGEVEEAEKLCAGDPMTYAYYHLVRRQDAAEGIELPARRARCGAGSRGSGRRGRRGGSEAQVRLALQGVRPHRIRRRAAR